MERNRFRKLCFHDRPKGLGLLILEDHSNHMTFEFLTAMVRCLVVFWVVVLCGLVIGYRRFGGTYRLHLHGGNPLQYLRASQPKRPQTTHSDDGYEVETSLRLFRIGQRKRDHFVRSIRIICSVKWTVPKKSPGILKTSKTPVNLPQDS
jgi:hypothetical protein